LNENKKLKAEIAEIKPKSEKWDNWNKNKGKR
jgi:hypothetical protein